MEKFKSFITEQKDEPYRILILSHDEEDDPNITGEKLVEKAKSNGLEYYMMEMDGGYVSIDDNGQKFAHNWDKENEKYDDKGFLLNPENTLVFVRGAITKRHPWLDTVTQLERDGFCCINSRHCHELCNDKYHTSLSLADVGLRQPKAVLISHADGAIRSAKLLNENYPLILKTVTGTHGVGVIFIESEKSLIATVQLLYKLDENIGLMLQEYVKTPFDVRVHVLDRRVVATLKRPVVEGDFRSNVSQGSKASSIELTDIEKEDCIKAAEIVDGLWVGVDFIPARNREKEQPFIIEVNSSPGSGQIDDVNNIDLIGIILEYYKDRTKWLKPKPFRSIYT